MEIGRSHPCTFPCTLVHLLFHTRARSLSHSCTFLFTPVHLLFHTRAPFLSQLRTLFHICAPAFRICVLRRLSDLQFTHHFPEIRP